MKEHHPMKTHAFRLAAWTLGLAGLLSLAAPSARAEFFEYTTTVTIDTTAGSFTPAASIIVNGVTTASITTPNGNQLILNSLNSTPAIPHINGGGLGADIGVLNLNANAAFASETLGVNFTMTVTITDYAGALVVPPTAGPNPNPVTFTFTGRIGGQLGNFQSNLDLLTFAPSPSSAGVGGAQYIVELKNFASPGTDQDGRLTLHVTAAVPEPSSVAMLGLGGLGALGMFRRSRKAKASA